MPLSIAVEQRWLADFAQQSGDTTIEGLKNSLLEQQIKIMKPELVKLQIIKELMEYEEIVEALVKRFQLNEPAELAAALSNNWSEIPAHLYQDEKKGAEAIVDRQLAFWRMRKDRDGNTKEDLVETMLQDVFGKEATTIQAPDPKYVDNPVSYTHLTLPTILLV